MISSRLTLPARVQQLCIRRFLVLLPISINIFASRSNSAIGSVICAAFSISKIPTRRPPHRYRYQEYRSTSLNEQTAQSDQFGSKPHSTKENESKSIMPPKASADALNKLSLRLKTESIDATDPSLVTCQEIVSALEKEGTMTIALLKQTSVGLNMGKALKTFRRQKRTSVNPKEWDYLIETSQRLLKDWKAVAAAEADSCKNKKKAEDSNDNSTGLPTSQTAYKNRLTRQQKEIYKDPPALPPAAVQMEEKTYPLPKRDKTTGAHTFVCGEDKEIKPLLKDFHPNRSPEEILRFGSFGGTYFRPIVSAVTNMRYSAKDVLNDTVSKQWIDGLDIKMTLTSSTYRTSVNKFGVKCGGSLGMWESSGWITDIDPYGWFQWYCRFYQGRRCSDDKRQISRWAKSAGPRGRFRSQLCNKILAANTDASDARISPVIRQTLLHWGLEVTPDILKQHEMRKK